MRVHCWGWCPIMTPLNPANPLDLILPARAPANPVDARYWVMGRPISSG